MSHLPASQDHIVSRMRVVRCAVLALVTSCVLSTIAEAAQPSASVLSLLSPAHGSAFAFGRPGHLLTTRAAVGTATIVKVVARDGQVETATVVSTTDPKLVQLRGALLLPPLHRDRVAIGRANISAVSGPLSGTVVESGETAGRGRGTTLSARRALEGAPIVDATDGVIGVATADGRHLTVVPVAGLRAVIVRARPSRSRAARSSLIGLVAILFAFGIGSGAARIAARRNIAHRLARRSITRQLRTVRPPAISPEADTGVHVVLRRRSAYEPSPDVRLLRRPSDRAADPSESSAVHAELPGEAE